MNIDNQLEKMNWNNLCLNTLISLNITKPINKAIILDGGNRSNLFLNIPIKKDNLKYPMWTEFSMLPISSYNSNEEDFYNIVENLNHNEVNIGYDKNNNKLLFAKKITKWWSL